MNPDRLRLVVSASGPSGLFGSTPRR